MQVAVAVQTVPAILGALYPFEGKVHRIFSIIGKLLILGQDVQIRAG